MGGEARYEFHDSTVADTGLSTRSLGSFRPCRNVLASVSAALHQLISRTTEAEGMSLADLCSDMIWLSKRNACIERPASQLVSPWTFLSWSSPSVQDSPGSEDGGTANAPLPASASTCTSLHRPEGKATKM